jgi:hypothetical protein
MKVSWDNMLEEEDGWLNCAFHAYDRPLISIEQSPPFTCAILEKGGGRDLGYISEISRKSMTSEGYPR